MAGRGPQSFKKRQREQLRKEKQEEKRAKRVERKSLDPVAVDDNDLEPNPILLELAGYEYEEPGEAKEKSAGDVV